MTARKPERLSLETMIENAKRGIIDDSDLFLPFYDPEELEDLDDDDEMQELDSVRKPMAPEPRERRPA